jgi:hypothetical protein
MSRFLATWISLGIVSTNAVLASVQESDVTKTFRKAVADSIGHQWYTRMEAHQDLKPGTTRVMIAICRDGTIRKLAILSNTSDQRAAALIIDAVKHLKIPQPPTELLRDNVFETEMKFVVYPKRSNHS